MCGIEGRQAALGAQVERIRRLRRFRRRGRCLIDGLGKCIRALHGEMAAEALLPLHLEAVIVRVGNGSHRGEAAPTRNDAVIVFRGESRTRRVDRGIGLVAVQQFVSELAHVGDFHHRVAHHLPLHRQIHLLDVWRAQSGIRVHEARQAEEGGIGEIRRQRQRDLAAQRIGKAVGRVERELVTERLAEVLNDVRGNQIVKDAEAAA